MLNIHDLERRWLRYKIKSYIPHAIASVLSIILLVALTLFFPASDNAPEKIALVETKSAIIEEVKSKPDPIQQEIIPVNIEVPENTNSYTSVQNKENEEFPTPKKETLVLKPSLHFMDNIEEGISPYVEEEYIPQNNTNTYIPRQSTIEPTENIAVQIPEVSKPKVSSLSITRHNDKNDLKDVIRRFKKNKNPALSLFIAKRYYADGKYQKSYNYALMTNEIDKHIDESWIIFAKSLVKLGQHELAINTLKSYLKSTKSSAASVLLRKIEGGAFR